MSDLQCAATFLVAPEGVSAADLPAERVAATVQGPDDLQGLSDLEDLADLHRGETVLLTGPATWRRALLAGWTDGIPQGDEATGPTGRLEVDADGWRFSPLPSPPPAAGPRRR